MRRKEKNNSLSINTWQDMYYDGWIDPEYETFDELSQETYNYDNINEHGWGIKGKGYIEDYSDDYYLRLKRGGGRI